MNNSSGIQGAAYEGSGPLVGAAFNQNSPRNSMRSSAEPFEKNPRDLPADYLSNLKRTTALLLKDQQTGDELVTAVFWEKGEILTSAEPWDQTLEHGVKVFNYELMEESEALSEVKEDYEFDDEVMSIVEDIYRKRISSQGQITIDEQSWEFIKSRGEAGIRECRKRLASIDIAVPS